MRVDDVAVNIRLSIMPGGLPHLCQGHRPSCCLLTKAGGLRGRAVQVDPVKPTLKAPGSKSLKQNMIDCFQNLLSSSTCAASTRRLPSGGIDAAETNQGDVDEVDCARFRDGVDGRSLQSLPFSAQLQPIGHRPRLHYYLEVLKLS